MAGEKNMHRAVKRDLEYLDLIKFIPGAPISALANFGGMSVTATRNRIRVLGRLGLVRIEIAGDCYKPLKLIYPGELI